MPTTLAERNPVVTKLWNAVVTAACAWSAIEVVPGVELTGTARKEAIVVVLITFLYLLVEIPSNMVGSPARQQRMDEWAKKNRMAGCLGYFTIGATAMLGGPIAWWLAELAADPLGLPFRLDGFWPHLTAPLMLFALTWLPFQAVEAFTRRGRQLEVAGPVLMVLAFAGGLWASLAMFDGFRLTEDTWWRSLMTLVAFATLFTLANVGVSVNYYRVKVATRAELLVRFAIAFVVAVLTNLLGLWLMSWVSRYLGLRLYVEGFGVLLLAAIVCTVAMWVVAVPARSFAIRRATALEEAAAVDAD